MQSGGLTGSVLEIPIEYQATVERFRGLGDFGFAQESKTEIRREPGRGSPVLTLQSRRKLAAQSLDLASLQSAGTSSLNMPFRSRPEGFVLQFGGDKKET